MIILVLISCHFESHTWFRKVTYKCIMDNFLAITDVHHSKQRWEFYLLDIYEKSDVGRAGIPTSQNSVLSHWFTK